ncbi:glyoxalase [Polaribacter sp.]|nr:glyoxalase [Polaribacter sp.]
MDNRKELRPVLAKIEETEKCSIEEKFQNTTLRQIIKLQHPLLIAIFKDYAITRKTVLKTLTEQRVKRFIESALSKDIAFKNKLIGLVIGQFTLEEFEFYIKTPSEFNKRIFAIIKKRLKDSLLELS